MNEKRIEIPVERMTIEHSVYYATLEPRGDAENPPLLIALHGFAQRCNRFIAWFDALRDHGVLVVAPQGQHQFYLDIASKKVGFNWLTVYERDQSIADFIGYMRRLIERIGKTRTFDPERVFILGFSQGVSMAYRFAVSDGFRPAGLIACCADLPADVAAKLPATKPFPVLLQHGQDDPMAPPAKGDEAEAILRDHGFPVERHVYPAGHEIPAEAIERIAKFIAAH